MAKLLWTELVLFIPALIAAIYAFGLIGAAVVASLRITLDAAFILRFAAVSRAAMLQLAAPAGCLLASLGAVAASGGAVQQMLLATILIGSILWSARNVPDVLRPLLRKLRATLPFAVRGR